MCITDIDNRITVCYTVFNEVRSSYPDIMIQTVMKRESVYMKHNKQNNHNNPDRQMASPTPYDDVFKTLRSECRGLLIPLINEAFGLSFGKDEEVTLYNNEHVIIIDSSGSEKRFNDGTFGIAGNRYIIRMPDRARQQHDSQDV